MTYSDVIKKWENVDFSKTNFDELSKYGITPEILDKEIEKSVENERIFKEIDKIAKKKDRLLYDISEMESQINSLQKKIDKKKKMINKYNEQMEKKFQATNN